MKLLLTSAGFENPVIGQKFLELLTKPVDDTAILFIPTASRTKEELNYVAKSKEELLKLGIKNDKIFIFDNENVPTYAQTLKFDVIYVCGGNTYYLGYMMKQTGFDSVLKEVVTKGTLYVGVSAGSILAGPDISISRDVNDISLTDFTGLGFTKSVVVVHYTNDEDGRLQRSRKKFHSVPLTDKQALVITDFEEKIVE